MELSDEQVRYKTLAELIASRVRVNQAAQVGTRAVDFVRGKDVVSWMQDHPEDLKSAGVASTDPLDLGSKLVALGLLRRADRADVHNVRKDDNSTEIRSKVSILR
ncbi:MAG: hypothetical protein KVP17_003135 [Porospora cf. gigantea B]|uniref:uncharacterized protein n=1 Tax=Porospora cf. gigantea B TaxID=2853592 RepID=UPI00357192B9|nr:MAG: hypothetical protein KVP17_003135 [Porospora cf. gigantea B]